MGFLRRPIKRDCLRASANGKPYPAGQLNELHARVDLLNMLVNVGAAKLAHDHEGCRTVYQAIFTVSFTMPIYQAMI